jgi:hypothetical protein
MASGGNRNSQLTVASSNDNRRGQEQFGSDDLEEINAEIRYADQHSRRILSSTASLPYQGHLNELEQQTISQMSTESQPTFGNHMFSSSMNEIDLALTEKQQTNDEGKLRSFLSTENQPTNFENLSSSSVADPVLIPGHSGRESQPPSFRPAPSRGAFGSNLTPYSNTLKPGSKQFESVDRMAQGGIETVDNWRHSERDVQVSPAQMGFSSRKGRVSNGQHNTTRFEKTI